MPAVAYPTTLAALTALSGAGVTHVVFHRGDASGDQPHVIPMLAMEQLNRAYNVRLPPGAIRAPIYGVIVIDALVPLVTPLGQAGPQVAGRPTAPRGQRMADSYVDQFRVSANLVAYVNLGQMMAAALNTAIPLHLPMRKVKLTGPNGATQTSSALVLNSKNYRHAIKDQFRGSKAQVPLAALAVPALSPEVLLDMQLDQYRQLQNIPVDRSVVVIWGRKSGKSGGLYPQMDSSATGMAQLAASCHTRGYTVLVAGDIVQAKMATHLGFAHAIWMGDFWNHWGPIPNRRDLQIRFFYLLGKQLKANHRRLVHVGMRSGGLDMYSFSGQRVIYLVAPKLVGGNMNDNRMPHVVNSITAARAAPIKTSGSYYYDRFVASRIPKAYGLAREKGFSSNPDPAAPGDLEMLMQRINAAVA
jgi:hypothetical protein